MHTHRDGLCLRKQLEQPQHHKAQTIHTPSSAIHCASCRRSPADSSCFRSVWSRFFPSQSSSQMTSPLIDHFGVPFSAAKSKQNTFLSHDSYTSSYFTPCLRLIANMLWKQKMKNKEKYFKNCIICLRTP